MDIPLDRHVCFKLYVASRLIVQSFADVLGSLKLTYPKYLVLTVLGERDGQTVGDLGGRLFLDSGTLSPLLKALEAAGHVTRERSPKDDRVVANFLTKSGRKVRDSAMVAASEVFCRTGITPQEFEQLHRGLDDFIQRCQTLQGSEGEGATAAVIAAAGLASATKPKSRPRKGGAVARPGPTLASHSKPLS